MSLIAALVRHGDYLQLEDTPSALQPFPLTADGERSAREAGVTIGQLLAERDWQLHPIIDSSQLLRSWQSATLMAEALNATLPQPLPLQVESFAALAERSVGSVANLSVAQIEALLQLDPRFDPPPANWKSDSHYQLPFQGGESLLQAGRRVADHLQQRLAPLLSPPSRSRPMLKLFVGHGAAIRHACHHLGILTLTQVAARSLYHAHPLCFQIEPDGNWQAEPIVGQWKLRQPQSQERPD